MPSSLAQMRSGWSRPDTRVLSTGLPEAPWGVALHAATLAIHQRLALDVQRYAGSVDMRVVPPLCPISVPPTDFGQADDLIRRAREHTRMWLGSGNVGVSVTAITEDDLVDAYRHDHVVRRVPRAR